MSATSWDVLKNFLMSGTPIQNLFSGRGVTHLFCIKQGIIILKNDGMKKHALFLNSHIDNLNRGVVLADKGWKYFFHYLNPEDKN